MESDRSRVSTASKLKATSLARGSDKKLRGEARNVLPRVPSEMKTVIEKLSGFLLELRNQQIE